MRADLGIVVAKSIEFEAVKEKLHNPKEVLKPGEPFFLRGDLAGFRVVVTRCSEQGSVCSALSAADLIRHFQPHYLALLGIAAGFPDELKLGDVIIADPVIGYEYSKVYNDSSEHEPRFFNAPLNPIQSFQQQVQNFDELSHKPSPETTKVRVGPLASGSKLVASKKFRDSLTLRNRKICALEMEAEGVAQAARHFSRKFFVVKGISDFADGRSKGRRQTPEKKAQHDAWQVYAARASVHVLTQLLEHCHSNGFITPAPPATSLPRIPSLPPRLSQEVDFLQMVREQPSLHVGNFSLNCKLFPPFLWQVEDRWNYLYLDEPERNKKIALEWIDSYLPEDTLDNLVRELQRAIDQPATMESFSKTELKHFREVHKSLTKGGSTAYPRLVAPPEIFKAGDTEILRIPIGPSRYGIALVEERQIQSPTAVQLRSNHILNSLAVRVAVTYLKNGEKWVEFHQRKGQGNATYKDAWDVGAAGYVDPQDHIDIDARERISPWRASAAEIEQELNISESELQNREHFQYFGIGRNDHTGQLDILGVCQLARAPDPARAIKPRAKRYDRCLLTPELVAAFILEKRYWVPTALLTLILVLQQEKFERPHIEAAFAQCIGKIKLHP